MSINSDFTGGGTFTRSQLSLALAFGQSNIGEGINTHFADLTPHLADDQLLFAVSMLSGPAAPTWGDIRAASGGRFGAMVQFLRSRFMRGEENWAGVSYSRGGYALADDWLPGSDLEAVHLRAILDRFGELLGYAHGHANSIHLDCLYYYQGESDMVTTAFANDWKKNWYELVSRFNAAGLTWDKVVIVKPTIQGYGTRPGFSRVIASIDEIATERADVVAVLDASEVGDDGGGTENATAHLNTVGQVSLGQSWSDRMP